MLFATIALFLTDFTLSAYPHGEFDGIPLLSE
jgi:hypothetical protein